jgi:5-methylcytosine-specific restriction endonuclease McrA
MDSLLVLVFILRCVFTLDNGAMNEEENERIGILADGNKISQAAAELLHVEQTKVNPFIGIVEKIRQLGLVQKMKKHSGKRDSKSLADRIYRQNRRTRKLGNGGKLSKGLADKLFKLQKGRCACCRELLGLDYHLDHKMPLALDGKNIDDNIQLLCPFCNLSKGSKHPIDFMQSKGFLL